MIPQDVRELIDSFSQFDASFYWTVRDSRRCEICRKEGPTIALPWVADKSSSALFRHPDGPNLAGSVYFVCFECHANLGDGVVLNAAEMIKADLVEALAGSDLASLEEAHR